MSTCSSTPQHLLLDGTANTYASSSAPLYETENIKLRVRQSSGAPLDIAVSAEQSPVFWAIYVGRFV